MQRIQDWIQDSLIWILAVAAVAICLSQSNRETWGAEVVTLFASPPPSIENSYSIELFPCDVPRTARPRNDFEPLQLFPCAISNEIKRPCPSGSGLFQRPASLVTPVPTSACSLAAHKVLPPGLKSQISNLPRSYVACYGPTYCVPCATMFKQIRTGDDRLECRCVKDDEAKFPEFIRQYGQSHGWPVLHWTAPSGKGAMTHGARSLDELAELVKTEPR